MLLKIGNICRDISDHCFLFFNRKPKIGSEDMCETQVSGFLVKDGGGWWGWDGGRGGCRSHRPNGLGTRGRPQACLRNPRKQFPGVLCPSILHPNPPIAAEHWPAKLPADSELFIGVWPRGLSFHSHEWTLWPHPALIFPRPLERPRAHMERGCLLPLLPESLSQNRGVSKG